MASEAVLRSVHLKSVCSSCSLRELCLPIGLSPRDMDELEGLVYQRRTCRRGEHLYRAGVPFQSLFAIRSGFFKTYVIYEDGREQVTGFSMMGEMMGLDGISADAHSCNAVALEDSEICEVPFAELEELSRDLPSLQHHLHKMMSREIVRDHGVMLLLGSMKAEERLATFLLNLSQRFQARGYSPDSFHLRMTREEIGSYLGLKLETVSRIFSKFHEDGLITVQNKFTELTDSAGLQRVIGQTGCST